MANVLIGIPGIGNKPEPSILREWWVRSIADGRKKIGEIRPFFDKVEIVYWADIIYPKPQDPDCKDPESPLYIKRPYTPDKNLPVIAHFLAFQRLKKKIMQKLADGLEHIFLSDNSFINYEALAGMIIKKMFQELDQYYYSTDEDERGLTKKEEIRSRVAESVFRHRKDRICLAAHSMGGIAAYDVLTLALKDVEIDTLLTFSSPLANPFIVRKIQEDRGMEVSRKNLIPVPENITRAWYNIADTEDKAAMCYDFRNHYSPNSRGISPRTVLVENRYTYKGKESHHKSFGYLRTAEAARIFQEFIKAGSSPSIFYRFINKLKRGILRNT